MIQVQIIQWICIFWIFNRWIVHKNGIDDCMLWMKMVIVNLLSFRFEFRPSRVIGLIGVLFMFCVAFGGDGPQIQVARLWLAKWFDATQNIIFADIENI